MARSRKLTCKAYIDIGEKKTLWYEIDEEKNVTWHLPQDIAEKLVDKMCDNIGENMSRYIAAHPNSALWEKTN